MKKLNALNLGKSLSRTEMKVISGGIHAAPACPPDDCYADFQCPKSYCANSSCKRNGIDSSWNSCQYVAGGG